MPTVETGEGLFIGLQIRETGNLTRFLDRIPPRVGYALPGDKIVLGMVEPDEPAFDDLDRKQRRNLGNSQRRIMRALGQAQIIGSEIDVVESELLPSGSNLELAVDPSDEIHAAREKLDTIVRNTTGGFLTPMNEWRLKVASKNTVGEVPELHLDPPRSLRVLGVTVSFGSQVQSGTPSRRGASRQRFVRHNHRQAQPISW